MRKKALVVAALPLLIAPVALAAYRDSNEAVSAQTQANGGGCYPVSRTGLPTEMLNLLNEGGDDPGDHESDDQNTLIDVDAADIGLVATGNVGVHYTIRRR